jgi:hypothetical protein
MRQTLPAGTTEMVFSVITLLLNEASYTRCIGEEEAVIIFLGLVFLTWLNTPRRLYRLPSTIGPGWLPLFTEAIGRFTPG